MANHLDGRKIGNRRETCHVCTSRKGIPLKRLTGWIVLLALAGPCFGAKYAVVFRLASPPLPVAAGQHFSLCAANVGRVNADLTLQFINVRTGAIVASRDVTLPPLGSAGKAPAMPPDPCLDTTSDAVGASAAASANPPLLVALVVIKHGLFSRASAATASVQVTAVDATGGHHLIASIPLNLATLINGRNTPIERVQ